jgi:hypothetical protein
VAAVSIAMALVAETGARLVRSGFKPATFVSPNVGLPADQNQHVFEEYERMIQNRNHGVVRSHTGSLTIFDAPGPDTISNHGPWPLSINPAGVIAGYYGDANGVWHGFIRAPSGAFTTFDAPGAVQGTQPFGINPAGVIAGTYYDASFVGHGFLRIP